jgi:cell division protein FtsN
MPSPPEPAETEPHAANSTGRTPSQRAVLLQHERDFRESLTSLSERVNELKAEVAELHSSDIFSVKIYKQSSEIERLAKQLKNLAKS